MVGKQITILDGSMGHYLKRFRAAEDEHFAVGCLGGSENMDNAIRAHVDYLNAGAAYLETG